MSNKNFGIEAIRGRFSNRSPNESFLEMVGGSVTPSGDDLSSSSEQSESNSITPMLLLSLPSGFVMVDGAELF